MTDQNKTVTMSPAEQMREAAAQWLEHDMGQTEKVGDYTYVLRSFTRAERSAAIRAIPLPPEPSPLDDPRVKALVEALELQNIWVKAALECKDWHWDAQQHDAATESLQQAEAVLRGLTGEVGNE